MGDTVTRTALPPASQVIVAALLALAGGAASLNGRVQSSASLRGQVVDSATGRAVEGAVVSVIQVSGGATQKRYTTDETGLFVFDGLPPGDYVVAASSRSYMAVSTYGDSFVGSREPIISLGAGQTRQGLILRLTRPSTISGRIVIEDGAAYVKAKVYALERMFDAAGPHLRIADQAVADDRGDYTLARLRSGRYLVAIAAEGGSPLLYPTIYFPDSRTASEGAFISLGPAEERTGINFSRRRSTGQHVSGVISGPQLPSIITLTPVEFSGASTSSLDTLKVPTEAGGRFEFSGVLQGRYALRAIRFPRWDMSTSGLRPTVSIPMMRPGVPVATLVDEPTVWLSETIDVDRDIHDLKLTLRDGYSLSGAVSFQGLKEEPSVSDLSRQAVNIAPLDDVDLSDMPLTRLGPNGRFRSVGLPAGGYIVDVQRPPTGWYVGSIRLNGRDLTTGVVQLDRDISNISIVMVDQPNEIHGVVRDARGAPVGCVVMLIPASFFGVVHEPRELRRVMMVGSGPTGVFNLQPLVGSYRLVAVSGSLPDPLLDAGFISSLASAAEPVEVTTHSIQEKNLVVRVVR